MSVYYPSYNTTGITSGLTSGLTSTLLNQSLQTSLSQIAATQLLSQLSNSSCGNMNNTCADGYSLYVPCLKNITRGTEVCFDFYVGDNVTQTELDTRKLDEEDGALSLTLSGVYGCEYKTYTYPEDIESQQTYNDKLIFSDDFSELGVSHLVVSYKDINKMDDVEPDFEPDITGKSGYFYNGETITLTANDTETHFFVGWVNVNEEDLSDGNTIDDIITSKEKIYTINNIEEDTEIIALYRKRKVYRVRVAFENRHSYFRVRYNDRNKMLSDKERDYVHILEGHSFIVTCNPLTIDTYVKENGEFKKDENDKYIVENTYTYNFISWKDNREDSCHRTREMIAGDDNPYYKYDTRFEGDEETIALEARCSSDRVLKEDSLNGEPNTIENPTQNEFFTNLPEECEINSESITESEFEYEDSELWDFQENIKQLFIGTNGCVKISKGGYLETTNLEIVDGVKIKFKIKPIETSSISIIINEQEQSKDFKQTEEFEDVEFYFSECTNSNIIIKVNDGEVYLDDFEVYEEEIIDKGLMKLCVPPEDTLKMYRGILKAGGVIMVGGQTFGIPETTIGNINNLKPININYE